MKILASILLLLIPMVAFAQDYQGMSKGDMQNMMQQMQKMQSCMQNVDQAKMKELEQLSTQVSAELKSLCASGQRDKAQKKAISFGKQMANNPTMLTIRKCGEMMEGMMPKMPSMETYDYASRDHVCD